MLSTTGIVGRIRKENREERLLPFPVTVNDLAEAKFLTSARIDLANANLRAIYRSDVIVFSKR
jgi:hypothetical protein